MRGLRRTEKFETDKPSNRALSESQGEAAKPKGMRTRTRQPLRGETGAGERKNRELSTGNRKGRMETGETEGESVPEEAAAEIEAGGRRKEIADEAIR